MFAREQVQKQSQSQSGELREPGAQGQIIDISTGFFSVELVELIERISLRALGQSKELREPGAQGQSKELREPGAQGQIIDISTGFFSVELVELIERIERI